MSNENIEILGRNSGPVQVNVKGEPRVIEFEPAGGGYGRAMVESDVAEVLLAIGEDSGAFWTPNLVIEEEVVEEPPATTGGEGGEEEEEVVEEPVVEEEVVEEPVVEEEEPVVEEPGRTSPEPGAPSAEAQVGGETIPAGGGASLAERYENLARVTDLEKMLDESDITKALVMELISVESSRTNGPREAWEKRLNAKLETFEG